MGNNRIAAVYNARIVPALVEHTHIQAEYVGNIDCASHTAFIGADYHHMIGINLQILLIAQQVLNELVCRLYGFKAVQGDGILYPRIVCVKGDDVVHAHFYKLLQCNGAVQGFTAGAFVLPAFIEEGHNYIDSSGFAAYGGNDSFQILEMIIRGHMIFMPA